MIRPFRFSLVSILIFVAIVGSLLIWLMPSRNFVRAKFRVNSTPAVIAGEKLQFDPNEFEFYRQGLIKLLRRDQFLTAVLRPPNIGSLNVVRLRDDPIEWIKRNLVIDCPDNNQILMIGFYGSKQDQEELIVLLDAISERFIRELVSQNYQELTFQRELKLRQASELKDKIDLNAASGEELRVFRQQWQKLIADSEADEINKNAEPRVQLFEPAGSSSN